MAETREPVEELREARQRLSQLERQRDALRASERLYRALVDRSQGLICTHDLEGCLLSANPAAARRLGYDPDEVVGQRLDRFLAPDARHLFPSYLERIAHARAANGLMRLVDRDGNEMVWLYGNSLYEEPGKPPYVLAHAQDITAFKRVERELRRSEAKFRSLVERASYGIFRCTVDGTLVTVNPALVVMLGCEAEGELLGVSLVGDVFADPAEGRGVLRTDRSADRLPPTDVRWRRRDGARITVRLSGQLVRGEGGEVEAFEMMVEDVTERLALEARLRQAQKLELLGQWTGGIAHDFNNILAVILTSAEVIAASLPPERTDLLSDLDELRGAGRRGTALVRRLLTFGRRTSVVLKPLNLGLAAGDLLAAVRRLMPATIEVQSRLDAGIPEILADAGVIEQILLNLVTNARDAMPEGGVIRVETHRASFDADHRAAHGWGDPGDYVCLTVRDTGWGMDEHTRRKIFEPFFTTKGPGQGTGLGMAMLYGLVKQHRGFVDVQSRVSQGTSVTVYFPVTVARAVPAASPESAGRLAGGAETILFVDDEGPVRRAAKRLLERYGYTVLEAADGTEGLTTYQARRSDIDLVVSDVFMPGMTGGDLYRAIRRLEPRVPFLLVSGYSLPDARRKALLDRTIPFMQKPWVPADLIQAVRDVLDLGHLRQAG